MVDMDREFEWEQVCGVSAEIPRAEDILHPTDPSDPQESFSIGKTPGGQWVLLKSIPSHGGVAFRQVRLCAGDVSAELTRLEDAGRLEFREGVAPSCAVADWAQLSS